MVLGGVVSRCQGGVARCLSGYFLLHDRRVTWQLNYFPKNVSPTLILDLVLSCLVPATVSVLQHPAEDGDSCDHDLLGESSGEEGRREEAG